MTDLTDKQFNDIQDALGDEFEVTDKPYGLTVIDRGLHPTVDIPEEVLLALSDERYELVASVIESVVGEKQRFEFLVF